jgi:hypothetical protein
LRQHRLVCDSIVAVQDRADRQGDGRVQTPVDRKLELERWARDAGFVEQQPGDVSLRVTTVTS